MGPADRHMTFRKGLSSSNHYMAQSRRRNPLPADPADLRLPDQIRRPALVPAGRGYLSDNPIAAPACEADRM